MKYLGNKFRKSIEIFFKTVLTGYFIWFIFDYVNWADAIHSLETIKISFVVVAILLMIPNIFFHWLKWDYLIRLLYPTIKKRRTVFSAISGITFDTLFVTTAGDYAGKMLGLNDLPKGSIIALNFFDKFQLLIITIIVGAVSFIIFGQAVNLDKNTAELTFWIGIGSLLAGMAGLFFCLVPKFYTRFFGLFKRFKWLFTEDAYQASQLLKNEDAFFIFFVNVLKYLTFNTQFYLILLAFTFVPIYKAFIAITAMYFAKSVITGISFSEIGSRGATSVYFFGKLGISTAIALNVALFVFIINRLIPSIFGFFIVLFLDIKYNPIKRRLKLNSLRKTRRNQSRHLHPDTQKTAQ